MGSHKKFPAEMRERAVRLVFEHQDKHESQWAAIVSVAETSVITEKRPLVIT